MFSRHQLENHHQPTPTTAVFTVTKNKASPPWAAPKAPEAKRFVKPGAVGPPRPETVTPPEKNSQPYEGVSLNGGTPKTP